METCSDVLITFAGEDLAANIKFDIIDTEKNGLLIVRMPKLATPFCDMIMFCRQKIKPKKEPKLEEPKLEEDWNCNGL